MSAKSGKTKRFTTGNLLPTKSMKMGGPENNKAKPRPVASAGGGPKPQPPTPEGSASFKKKRAKIDGSRKKRNKGR